MNRAVAAVGDMVPVTPGIHAGYAPLPHLIQGGTLLSVGLVFDRAAIAPLLPKGTEPTDEGTGGVLFIDAPDGWGLTPCRTGQFFIDVKGFDSDAGLLCRHHVHGFVEGEAAARYHRRPLGHVTFAIGGDRASVSAGPPGADHYRLSMRLAGESFSAAEARNFLVIDDTGAPHLSPVSSLADRIGGEDVSFEILADDDMLRRLRPREVRWARYAGNLSVTCGAWMPLGELQRRRAPPDRAAFLSFLSRFDRAAALVERDGSVVLINGRAERLIGNGIGVANGHLRCARPGNQATLDGLIAAALDNAVSLTGRLDRSGEGAPIIVKAMPFEMDLPGRPVPRAATLALLVFADPSEAVATDPEPALQLLGLTPSEARAAALVGRGLGPREAAEELGLSENSVRTTIKRVFSKLALSRQSELAVLVSRIASLGV
ncbi:MAG: helix-turn-helix transcriptional regulator [Bauldia sp.]|nr:helix-turn-helix transcriptional regulator [Bauldia sp.]